MQPGMAYGCAKGIALSIQRKFRMAVKLSFLMRRVWPYSGPDVVYRKAARSCGRTVAERNAIVIDRFFDTKQKALSWAKAHPHFMTVRILTPGATQGKVATVEDPGSPPPNIASNCCADLGTAE